MTYAVPPMVTYGAAPQPMTFMAQQPMTYAAAPTSMAATCVTASRPTAFPAPAEAQLQTVFPMPSEAQPSTGTVIEPQKLAVSILQAHGLQHLNHFTGDHPYVTCEVKGVDGHSHTKVETKPVTEGDTKNPFWGETFAVEPWNVGENLEFSVYDKGLIGSRTKGKVLIPHELFYPVGFSGMLLISGLPQALLHIIVRPMGPSFKEAAVDGATLEETSSKKKTRKLKTGKKQKGCC